MKTPASPPPFSKPATVGATSYALRAMANAFAVQSDGAAAPRTFDTIQAEVCARVMAEAALGGRGFVVIARDGLPVRVVDTEDCAFRELLRLQSASTSHAIRYEGWSVETVAPEADLLRAVVAEFMRDPEAYEAMPEGLRQRLASAIVRRCSEGAPREPQTMDSGAVCVWEARAAYSDGSAGLYQVWDCAECDGAETPSRFEVYFECADWKRSGHVASVATLEEARAAIRADMLQDAPSVAAFEAGHAPGAPRSEV